MPVKSLAERYLDAWNRHDLEEVMSYFSTDAVYIDTTLDRELVGAAEIRKHVEWMMEVCPDVNFEILDGSGIGNGRLSIEWYMHGSNLDPFYLKHTQEQGKPLHGLDFITYDGGKFLSVQVYFDRFHRPVISRSTESEVMETATAQQPKYQKSGLSEEDLTFYEHELVRLMEEENFYQEHDLTLVKLANHMEISTNYLSQVINSKFRQNFNDFINHYRIQKAMDIIANVDNKEMSTLDIAFEVGFGSSSAFYLAFKKRTKMTPTEYKNKL